MTAGASDIETALSAASADSAIVRAAYGSELVQHAKGGHDFATNADLDAERAILDVIAAARPGDVRIGEETGTEGGSSSRRWLVDPLSGTRNFAAQTPLVAVNVALVDASSVAAVCADPIAGELFWTDGQRSFRRTDGDDVPLSPSAESGLVDVNCDGPADNPFLGRQLVARYLHPDVQAMLDAGAAFSAWWSPSGPQRPNLAVVRRGRGGREKGA